MRVAGCRLVVIVETLAHGAADAAFLTSARQDLVTDVLHSDVQPVYGEVYADHVAVDDGNHRNTATHCKEKFTFAASWVGVSP